jgi:hypothetical protein
MIAQTETKKCAACEQELPLSDFYSWGADHYTVPRCRKCHNRRQTEYRRIIREEQRQPISPAELLERLDLTADKVRAAFKRP